MDVCYFTIGLTGQALSIRHCSDRAVDGLLVSRLPPSTTGAPDTEERTIQHGAS